VQNPASATSQVAALEVGETYTRSRYIPGNTPNLGEVIQRAKRELSNTLTPVLTRARSRVPSNVYSMHGFHGWTTGYDVVVAVVVVRELGL
jgi:hypothetical protein